MSSTMRWVVTEDGEALNLAHVDTIQVESIRVRRCNLEAYLHGSDAGHTLMRFACSPASVLSYMADIMEILLGSDMPNPGSMYALTHFVSQPRQSRVVSLMPDSDARTSILSLVGIMREVEDIDSDVEAE